LIRSLTWRPYLWQDDRPADPAAISNAEKAIGFRFPQDYRSVVAEHQGKTPWPNAFDFGGAEERNTTAMNGLFHFLKVDDPRLRGYHLLQNFRERSATLPPGIVPFSEDAGGNAIAFDFRTSAEAPAVVLVDHERMGQAGWIQPVADSFTEFLNLLYDPFAR
jgi:cell wall assembly regulator SMI1